MIEYIATTIAVLALLLSLQANLLARKSKSDSDRNLLSEKKRDLLREIDMQHIMLLRVRFVLQEELLQLEYCQEISQVQPSERDRIDNNLIVLDKLEQFCVEARAKAAEINVRYDTAKIDIQFAEVGRLTSHLQVDLEREQKLLEGKKNLVRTSRQEHPQL